MKNHHRQKIIVYGAGGKYSIIKDKIFEQYDVVAIVDSNPDKQGFITNGYKIIAPEQIDNLSFDFILITTMQYYYEICSWLINEKKVDKAKIKPLDVNFLLGEISDLYDEKSQYQEEIRYLRNLIIEMKLSKFEENSRLVEIVNYAKMKNDISIYWTNHTVHDGWFITAEESHGECLKRFSMYPKHREFLDMDRNHSNDIILDYGCGPGHDVIWFTSMCKAKYVIGMDVSESALKNTQFRLALHNVKSSNVKLIQINETEDKLPLEDESIDFVNCQGVLMHTTNPQKILKEFYRVLKKKKKNESCMNIMVYNKDSIYYHLYAAYYLRYIDNRELCNMGSDRVEKMSVDEVFGCSTDGVECPKAVCWTQSEFTNMLQEAGFSRVEYKGGYPNNLELIIAEKYLRCALEDKRLEEKHKLFLRDVVFSEDGYPMYDGKICCIGGAYSCYL